MKGKIIDLNTEPLTEQEVKSLCDDKISKNQYDYIIAKISAKTEIIWKYIISKSNRSLSWWAFINDRPYRDGDGSDGGFFRPDVDSDFITIIGENTYSKLDGYSLNEGFPTEFLWTDYKSWVDSHVELCKESTKNKKEQDKLKKEKSSENRKKLIQSIRSKLSKEELSIINFKK